MPPFSFVPALKRTPLDALILMASPVAGLRALRAFRFTTSNDPKPKSWTFLFYFSESVMVSRSASRVSPPAFFDAPVPVWITEMRWSLSRVPAGAGARRIALLIEADAGAESGILGPVTLAAG